MSIETLPNELLVKILSHVSWDTRRDLSRVNRHFYKVIGQLSSLILTKPIGRREYAIDVCIPLKVLYGSTRQYCQLSCYMQSMDSQIMDGDFGTALQYCHQRWNIVTLRLVTHHKQFTLFLQHYDYLLNDIVTAHISVYDDQECATCDFAIKMEKLKRLNLVYKAPTFCFLSLHAPELEFLSVDRHAWLYLTFTGGPKLRSVWIRGDGSICDPVELRSILPQAPKTTRLEITAFPLANSLTAMFVTLQTIILTSATIIPLSNGMLECLNLKNLQLRAVKLHKPLKLRVPQLHTLSCNIRALQSLYLHDAFKADLLVIDFTTDKSPYNDWKTTPPDGFPRFRRLHLLLWLILEIDDINISWIWPYLSGVFELTLQTKAKQRCLTHLRNIWKHFPVLHTVCLVGMEVPGKFDFLPVTVQNVSIENCSTEGSSIAFPTSVKRVRVTKLWKWKTDLDPHSDEMILLPPNRYIPVEPEIVRADGLFRKVYSTKTTKNHMIWIGYENEGVFYPSHSHMTFVDGPELRSVWIRGDGSIYDPVELRSTLPQVSETTRLEITNSPLANNLSTLFGNLQTIVLTSATITPLGSGTLNCLNLTKLQLHAVKLHKPLKLRVPQLHTLICNIGALQLLHLHEAFKADLLVIDFTADESAYCERVPTLPSFRRLHLILRVILEIDAINHSWIWPYLRGITELTLQTQSKQGSLDHLRNIWKHFPVLNTLCMVGMEVPGNLDFLPDTVQNVSIEDCSTEGSSIAFPPTVQYVRVKKLWKWKPDLLNDDLILLLQNRRMSLESEIVQGNGMLWEFYSTKDCLWIGYGRNVLQPSQQRDVTTT